MFFDMCRHNCTNYLAHSCRFPPFLTPAFTRCCAICEKPVKVAPSQMLSRRTCSRDCASALAKREGVHAGANNGWFKGGTVIDKRSGYVRVLGIPQRTSGKRNTVYEHRLVMEIALNRKLQHFEQVHHLNGIKTDNRLSNLFLIDLKNHTRNHLKLLYTVSRLERIVQLQEDEIRILKERLQAAGLPHAVDLDASHVSVPLSFVPCALPSP